ncbi:MAG TPA: hypothetical protein VFC51_04260 [Chloroflexota bacterium]|nr:hypothetical protein [Chloroflexota bacterium]
MNTWDGHTLAHFDADGFRPIQVALCRERHGVVARSETHLPSSLSLVRRQAGAYHRCAHRGASLLSGVIRDPTRALADTNFDAARDLHGRATWPDRVLVDPRRNAAVFAG